MAKQMMFTPETAVIGGLVLGMTAVAKYALTGRILGMSGILRCATVWLA